MYSKEYVVKSNETALEVGSGNLKVLATPILVAYMENAAMSHAASLLDEGQTTVGSFIQIDHLAPSAVGTQIKVTIDGFKQDGRLLSYSIQAYQGDTLVGRAQHQRAIVDAERFMTKIK